MGKIEERAKEYAYFNMHDLEVELDEAMSFVENAYKDGAREERALLTEWHDPKEELPKGGRQVLLKVRTGFREGEYIYATARYNGIGWRLLGTCSMDKYNSSILGWRPIED